MKKYYIGASALAALLIVGFLVPLGSYTTTYGCGLKTTPTSRLHLINGDSLNEVKSRKDPVGAGCTVDIKYILYFL